MEEQNAERDLSTGERKIRLQFPEYKEQNGQEVG